MRGKHGKHGTPVYQVWNHMLQRCTNPKNPGFKHYGGRGITVCERWLQFANFYADMGDPPPGLMIEREDNDKGYSPDNCVWADRLTQNHNKGQPRKLTPEQIETILLSNESLAVLGMRYGVTKQAIWYHKKRKP